MTLRMTCLDRKLQGMSALTDVLAQADPAMLEKAPAAAAGLASLDTCSDVPALLAEVPPPNDPRLRDKLVAIRAQVSHAFALRLAGRLAAAATEAHAAVQAALATGDRVILAETLAEEGRAVLSVDTTRAIDLLTEAFWDAYSTRLDRLAVASATWLSTAYTLSSRYDQAIFWQEHAQAGLDRIGGDDELEAELWAERGRRCDEMGKYDESLTAYSRAERLTEKRLGPDNVATLRRQNDELTALTNANRVLEASQLLAPLLQRQTRLLGERHPMVARSLMDLGDDEVAIGRLASAHEHLARAEELYRAAGITGSLYWIALRRYQVGLFLAEGKMAEAEATSEDALKLLESASMSRTELAFELRSTLGRARIGLGQAAPAVVALERALAEAEAVHGKESATLTPLLSAIAEGMVKLRQLQKANAFATRALAIARKQSGEGRFDVAEARIGLAGVLVAQGQAAEALAALEASEPAVVRALGESAPLLGRARRLRGEALLALGRRDEAKSALTSALAIAERAGTSRSERDAIARELPN
jgi:tetratricopeptide (TPR) repeat protein